MKKLMIAAAIVCAAAMAQAASFSWSVTGMPATTRVFWDNGSVKTLYSTTSSAAVYLFDSAVVSQDALLTALRADSTKTLASFSSVASTTLDSNSKLTSVSDITYGESGSKYNFYMAVFDAEGNVFLSGNKEVTAQDATVANVSFTGVASATQTSWTTDATAVFSGESGKGAGWYAVPEPTSGLLMLLGFAGLALRRKRA